MLSSPTMRSSASNPRARWFRVLACLFVCAILADIAFDASCDAVSTYTVSGPGIAASGAGAQDPCANGCVPDCFCCSQSVTRGPAVLPPDAGPATLTVSLPPNPAPAGIRPVPYHPPLSPA